MLNLGKKLMKNEIDNVQWIKKNIITDNIEEKADLVISSYVLNEIKAESRNQILEKLWNSTGKLLLIIEPGTPEGYNQIKEIRDYFIKKGANIVAPCAHEKECKISKNDWCAFSCRVARTKVHKLLKEGEAPYEDEKFSYIAVSKMKTDKKDRILRHPQIENGRITLKLCTTEGDIEEKTITKKEKEKYTECTKTAGLRLERLFWLVKIRGNGYNKPDIRKRWGRAWLRSSRSRRRSGSRPVRSALFWAARRQSGRSARPRRKKFLRRRHGLATSPIWLPGVCGAAAVPMSWWWPCSGHRISGPA